MTKQKGSFAVVLIWDQKVGRHVLLIHSEEMWFQELLIWCHFSPKQFNHSSFYLIWRLNFPQSNIIDLQKILRLGKNSRWVKFPVTHTSHCPAEGLWRKCAITSSELCLFLFSHLILSLAMLWTVWQYHFKNPLEIHRQEYGKYILPQDAYRQDIKNNSLRHEVYTVLVLEILNTTTIFKLS